MFTRDAEICRLYREYTTKRNNSQPTQSLWLGIRRAPCRRAKYFAKSSCSAAVSGPRASLGRKHYRVHHCNDAVRRLGKHKRPKHAHDAFARFNVRERRAGGELRGRHQPVATDHEFSYDFTGRFRITLKRGLVTRFDARVDFSNHGLDSRGSELLSRPRRCGFGGPCGGWRWRCWRRDPRVFRAPGGQNQPPGDKTHTPRSHRTGACLW